MTDMGVPYSKWFYRIFWCITEYDSRLHWVKDRSFSSSFFSIPLPVIGYWAGKWKHYTSTSFLSKSLSMKVPRIRIWMKFKVRHSKSFCCGFMDWELFRSVWIYVFRKQWIMLRWEFSFGVFLWRLSYLPPLRIVLENLNWTENTEKSELCYNKNVIRFKCNFMNIG